MKPVSSHSYILSASALLLTSYSTLRTVDGPIGKRNSGKAYTGLHYFLPRGTITLKAPEESRALSTLAADIVSAAAKNELDDFIKVRANRVH